MVRHTWSDGRQKEERVWERWRDEGEKKKEKWKKRRIKKRLRRRIQKKKKGNEATRVRVGRGGARKEQSTGEKNGDTRRRRKRGWNLERMRKWLFLVIVVVRNFGVASAVFDNVQNREGKLEETQ